MDNIEFIPFNDYNEINALNSKHAILFRIM